jgi:hypothetical protein
VPKFAMPVPSRVLIPEVLPAVMPQLPAVPEFLPVAPAVPVLPSRVPADLPAAGRASTRTATLPAQRPGHHLEQPVRVASPPHRTPTPRLPDTRLPGQGQRPGDGRPPATGQATAPYQLPRTVDHHPMRRHRRHDHPPGTRGRTASARADARGHDPLDGKDPAPSRETGWRSPQHMTGHVGPTSSSSSSAEAA